MKAFSFLLTFSLITLTGWGQAVVILQEGTDIKEVLNAGSVYKYPEFTPGEVSFKDGPFSKARLNYNLLLGEMQFVDAKGDTLSIANENTIKLVAIGRDTFFYEKEFLQLVSEETPFKLATRERLIVSNNERYGAYGQKVPTNSVTSYSSIVFGNMFTKLSIKEVVHLKLKKTYYLGDKFNYFIPINKKSLIKRFGMHEKKIEDYLSQNSPKFDNKDDMTKLIKFLQQL